MKLAIILMMIGGALAAQAPPDEPIVIGSKTFTEGYLLAEIMAQTLEASGLTVQRRFGFGATLICYEALKRGEIDVYPEYTGTISRVILGRSEDPSLRQLNNLLAEDEVEVLAPFGFDNTYAITVTEQLAKRYDLHRISDLAALPELRLALSYEFMNREDGWPGLAARYGLAQQPRGIEHALAYPALIDGSIDATDAYVTDGELLRYELRVLEDDLGYFPAYMALPLTRRELSAGARQALLSLADRIDSAEMRRLNARVIVDEISFAGAAAEFLNPGAQNGRQRSVAASSLARNTLVHLKLTGLALFFACIVGIISALAVYRSKRLSRAVLYLAGLMQTIPSIALLALLIPVLGVGQVPAIVALFLYSLLPIMRSTVTALLTIDPLLRRVARALGMTTAQQIRIVLVPLALPHVLAGLRTAAVISIGTATLAAFIGAGGLGEPIVTGLALNDTRLILSGAIPAAALALLTELLFELLERRLIHPHMLQGRLPN